jgi:hypothetical protein
MGSNRQTDLDWHPFGWSTPRLLLIGLILALSIALLVFASTSTAGFSPYNANWDGTGEFRELADSHSESVVAPDIDQYDTIEPNTTTAFVFAPERAYNTTAIAKVREFVEAGGTLVVAGNYGPHGNNLLLEVGATAQFEGRVLRDERHNFRSPAMPIANNISSHQLLTGVDALTLNYGTAIEPEEATPIANTSEFGYLDQNGSTTLGEDAELQQYPVVTTESVGEGTVVVVGDPSLFINSMLGETDNTKFATTLIEHRPVTLLDQSHTSSPPPLVATLLLVRSSPVVAAGILSLLVGFIAAISNRFGQHGAPRWKQWIAKIQSTLTPPVSQSHSATIQSPRADKEALIAQLRERHPDWDDDRIDRVITGVLLKHTNEQDNE